MEIGDHTINPECNLYHCEIQHDEIKLSGLQISEEYSGHSLRLVFGATISIDNNEYEKIAYIECMEELQEWQKLSDAVKAYRLRRGEKKDSRWVRCTNQIKNNEVDALISLLITINKDFEKAYDCLSSLIDGIEEQRENEEIGQ